jgi:predicted membrane protein
MPSYLQLFMFFMATMLFAVVFFTIMLKTMPKSTYKPAAKKVVEPKDVGNVIGVHAHAGGTR